MERIKFFECISDSSPRFLVQRKFFQFIGVHDFENIIHSFCLTVLQIVRVGWLVGHKLAFFKIEIMECVGEFMIDAETEKYCEMKSKEERKIGCGFITCPVEMVKCIFNKIKKIGVAFRLFE